VDKYINTFRLRPEGVRNCEKAVLYPVEGKALDYFNEGPCENVTKELFKLKNHTFLTELLGTGASAAYMENPARDDSNYLSAACNDSYFCMRVQDMITTYVMLKEAHYKEITLAGIAANALPALAAAALLGCKAVIDLKGVDESAWEEKLNNQPLMGKLGGLKGLALLNVRKNVTFCGVSDELKAVLLAQGANVSDKQLLELL
jgi:hypothetical protein